MSFIQSLDAEITARTVSLNGEVVESAFKECLESGMDRKIFSDLMRRLAPTCEYRKVTRKIRRTVKRVENLQYALDACGGEDWWRHPGKLRRLIKEGQEKLQAYYRRINGVYECRNCFACRLDDHVNRDHFNHTVKQQASEIGSEVRDLLRPILT